jgi:hypothetical protein
MRFLFTWKFAKNNGSFLELLDYTPNNTIQKKIISGGDKSEKLYSTWGFHILAAAAAPSATSAPKPSFPGPGAARVGAPAGASPAVAAPLWVRPEAVLNLVRLRLALGYRFGSWDPGFAPNRFGRLGRCRVCCWRSSRRSRFCLYVS